MVQRTINPYYDPELEEKIDEEDDSYKKFKKSYKGDPCDFCGGPIGSAEHIVFRGMRLWKVFCSHKCHLDMLKKEGDI
jgi:hypothetical protein